MPPENPTPHGDEEALFHHHNARLVRSLQGRLRIDRDTAEEAVQFAWLALFRHQPDRERIGGWLYTVAKHEAYAILRRRDREQLVEVSEEPYDPALAEQIDRRELVELLDTAIAQDLTDNQRAALTLWAQGYPYKEIAERLGKTYTWTNRHVNEGLRRLRQRFDREPD